MNEHGVRTTSEEKANFPYDDYPLIDFVGTFRVTLKDKVWGKHVNIIRAFKTDDGRAFRINLLRRSIDEGYGPSKSKVDFAKAPLGSKWICTFVQKGNFVNMTDAVSGE